MIPPRVVGNTGVAIVLSSACTPIRHCDDIWPNQRVKHEENAHDHQETRAADDGTGERSASCFSKPAFT